MMATNPSLSRGIRWKEKYEFLQASSLVHGIALVLLVSTTIPALAGSPSLARRLSQHRPSLLTTPLLQYDIDLPSGATGIPGGTLAVRVHAPTAAQARYPAGAPVVIIVTGGDDIGKLRYTPPQSGNDLIVLTFLFPGGQDASSERRSDGVYDHRGTACIAALRDVIRYAAGELRDTQGRTIDDLLAVAVLHDNIGLLALSNGGNIAIAVAAQHGRMLAGALRYVVQWETPVSSQAVTADMGQVRLQCPPGVDGRNAYVNPRYRGYGPLIWDVDLSDLAYDPAGNVRVFHDGTGDGRYTTVLDPRSGCRTPDLDLNGRMSLTEDWLLSAFSDDAKHYYSRPVAQALVAQHVITGTWPADIGTPAETAAYYWDMREAVRLYAAALTNIPDLQGMVLASVKDHVQSAPDKPHIHQAYDGFRKAAGLWTRLNPDRVYIQTLDPAAPSGMFPDNPANSEPVDWLGVRTWAHPTSSQSARIVPLAAIAEMADRTRADEWCANLDRVLEDVPQATPEPTIPSPNAHRLGLPVILKG